MGARAAQRQARGVSQPGQDDRVLQDGRGHRHSRDGAEMRRIPSRGRHTRREGREAAGSTPDHTGLDCRTARTGFGLARKTFDMGLRMQAYFRREGPIERFGGWYDCFFPQALCSRWEEETVEGGWRRREVGKC
ncbi:hypothetical protein CPAR01_00646 [Colletotrichum paranaense]|uniref:Uncharacterized protein n=1 Tax=Colletotrichum paranaense TaxID=1914294 RepID=A0ABQ9T4H4_9PEZI|nr:uncharacterized protein CPAR01_00646 [Colletotrichum paranaense]KAK1546679.1 hypothetical protein CPAR01_00646 [Colletotrichum paranaense]